MIGRIASNSYYFKFQEKKRKMIMQNFTVQSVFTIMKMLK